MGEHCRFFQQDVTDEHQWGEIVQIEDTSIAVWKDVVGVNLEGTFLGCRAAVRAMKSTSGSIVNLSSTSGMVGDADYAAYDASKGGCAY